MSEQTVLIINGRDMRYGSAKGALNTFLADTAASHLKEEGFTVETTRVADGYEIAEEARKWQQADVVLFQFPIYWFAAPAVLKRYIEEVYQHDTLYSSAPEYGRGRLLHGKRYLVSTTWNAPKDVFADPSSFFNGRSVDDVLADFHFTQAFVGLTRLPSISFHDVIKHPDAAAYAEQLKTHLNKALNI